MSKNPPNNEQAAEVRQAASASLASMLIEAEPPPRASAAVKRARETLIEFVASDADALASLSPAALRIVMEFVRKRGVGRRMRSPFWE